MKNHAPKLLKEVVQELDKIDENMARFINERFDQNDYENGYEGYIPVPPLGAGPLDFFSWHRSYFFSFGQFEKNNKRLNKIFKNKAKVAKKSTQTTIKIDYAGCDPEIAKFLKKHGGKRGILCSNRHGVEDFVIAYCKDNPFPYLTEGDSFATAIPAKPYEESKKSNGDVYANGTFFGRGSLSFEEVRPKVKNAVALMQALIDKGYEVNSDGIWTHMEKCYFVPGMWQFAGTDDLGDFNWELEWLV